MEVEWFLCSLCMIELSQTLKLTAIHRSPERGECRMCGKKVYGSYYKVEYKTKGDKRD